VQHGTEKGKDTNKGELQPVHSSGSAILIAGDKPGEQAPEF
jgi:hypothetical protein